MSNKKRDYFLKITDAISTVFDPESENYLGDDFMEGDNPTDFMHVLANIVPTNTYNKLTNSTKNSLEFNHIANTLCFQNSSLTGTDEEE